MEKHRVINGNAVSPGVILGPVMLYEKENYEVLETYVTQEESELQYQQFLKAVETAKIELCGLMEHFHIIDREKEKIFGAHRELLSDEEMLEEIQTAIQEEKKSAAYAVSQIYATYIDLLSKAKDELIAARAADLCDVRDRMLRILLGKPEKNLSALTMPVIVVAKDLLPSDTATLDQEHVIGIITEVGGTTSHTAIIARSYKIPAIVGVSEAMKVLNDGQIIAMDAIAGNIVIEPSKEMKEEYEHRACEYLEQKRCEETYRNHPAMTIDGEKIAIGINVGGRQYSVEECAYDYIGLLRTEFLYMESTHLPTEEEQYEAYCNILKLAHGKAVTLRTLDIGGDKTLNYMELPKEDNPFLGVRALRFCFENPELFRTQLRAALRASAVGPLQIMFPMVGSMEDLRKAKAYLEEAKLELRQRGETFDEHIRIGVMIEIPSIALLADQVAQEVDFASIGTNDLTQYLCASDRLNPKLTEYYQSYSPALFRLLGFVAQEFTKHNKELSICGELAGDKYAVKALIGLGYRKLSMNSANIAGVKATIAQISLTEAKKIANRILSSITQEEVKMELMS